MVDSGLRVGEVIKLTAADLFLDEGYCYVEDKKNLKRRQVPLSEAGQAALRAYLDDRPLTGDPAHIFRKRCGRPITYESIRLLIRRLEERLEIKLNPHLFRHTFATLYLKNGGNMKYLQQILGHSSIDTTSRFYTPPEWADIKAESGIVSPEFENGASYDLNAELKKRDYGELAIRSGPDGSRGKKASRVLLRE